MCTVLEREQIFISNQKEIVHVRTYCYQFTPASPACSLYRTLLTLHVMYFFLYPRNLDIIKYTKLNAFFILLVPPTFPRLRKNCSYGTGKINH